MTEQMTTNSDRPSPGTEPDFDWSWTDDDPTWVAPAVDTSRPNVARMYDYSLGGKDNYPADREAAERAFTVMPDGPALARGNRAFLGEAIRRMSRAGIDQFVDLGSGIPTSPNTHELAFGENRAAQVVYVDNDPVVLAHTRALVSGVDNATGILRDIRDPDSVLSDAVLKERIDLNRPVGLLMIAVLHFVDLSVARQVVHHYLERLPAGSHLAFSLATFDGVPPEVSQFIEKLYRGASAQIVFRSRAQVEELIDGVDVVEPGIVDVSHWNPDGSGPLTMRMHSGIAVKR